MNDAKQLLESFFGEEAKEGSKNYFFHCPKCGHHKRKLLIEKENYQWHCWICETTNNTKGRSLYSLFNFFGASQYYINEAKKYQSKNIIHLTDEELYESNNLFDEIKDSTPFHSSIKLPDEFKLISEEQNVNHPEYKNAFHYLTKRNIRLEDILRYDIGYCQEGEYKKRIIIPSYDKFFRLNYFIARAYFDNIKPKYQNPIVDKTKIIPFESFINWSLPLTIVEGVFDAIPVRYNVTSLLGSSLSKDHRLMQEILLKKPPQINLILDNDAIDKAILIAESIMNEDINVKLVLLEDDRDPNELGFSYLYNKIKETQLLDFEKLMKVKLKL